MTKRKWSYKWEMIVLLWLAFFFHQADRQIFNVVLPAIQHDLGLSDAEMGLVAGILTLVYGILVPIAGFLGDRINKKTIIIVSLFGWSIATLFTGMASLLIYLIMLRGIATGAGEAFYSPSANALIGEYHEKTRSTAMSIHQTALYAGIVISGYLAGWIADVYNWRMAFFLFGGFGVLLGFVLILRLKAGKRPGNAGTAGMRLPVSRALSLFFKRPTVLLITLAFAGMVFVNVGFMTWMPTYLHEKFGFSLARSGFDATFYHYLAAFFGVLLGARLSDRYAGSVTGIRAWVQALGLLLGAPFILLIGQSQTPFLIYVSLTLFGFFRGVYDSNIFATLFDVIEPEFRSSATGLMLMFAFVSGATSPYILGILKPRLGLSWGLSSLAVVYVLSALSIIIALKWYYRRDARSLAPAASAVAASPTE